MTTKSIGRRLSAQVRLTKVARAALERIASGDDGCLHPNTVDSLLKKGLIERYDEHGLYHGMRCITYRYRATDAGREYLKFVSEGRKRS